MEKKKDDPNLTSGIEETERKNSSPTIHGPESSLLRVLSP